jgi:hypothetical protein
MCCQNMGLYPKDCAATIQLFTLQNELPICGSLPYTVCFQHTVFTLQTVLSLHDSLPYRLCCHYTTLYPTDCDFLFCDTA